MVGNPAAMTIQTAAPPIFMPGLELNRRFYWEAVRPILDRELPGLTHSAALIGYGSDVLGYDTSMSTDHNWGPRLQLFLAESDYERLATTLDECLRAHLPSTFLGYSVHFSPPDLAGRGAQQMTQAEDGAVNHLVEITAVQRYFQRYLAIEPDSPLTPVDWLALPEQKLLEVTAGAVYFDGLDELEPARARFDYFPRPVWLCRLAAHWQRIAEEEPFMGRTGDLGDELGSRLLAARLARDLMRLAFLYARRYTPYSKWLGTAFTQLPIAATLKPLLLGMVEAGDWQCREGYMVQALTTMAEVHNTMGITPALSPATRPFFSRPFQVLMAGRFADAIAAEIDDPLLRTTALTVGAVDQFTDCVPIHSNAHLAARLRAVYATQDSQE
jgi:hypothetical protein